MASSDHPTSIRLPREIKAYLVREALNRRWGLLKLVEDILRTWVEWDKKQPKGKR